MASPPDFERSYELAFPLSRVFAAWISEDTVIAPAARMQVEPEVGGAYVLEMPGGSKMAGRFLELIPQRRLRYSWQWQGDPEVSEVTVHFAEAGEGCQVTIAHLGFQSPESCDNHARGWDAYIAGLTEYLGAHA